MRPVEAYKEYLNEIKESLEAKYNYLEMVGNIQEAYDVLGKLMRYKLIDRSDKRLQPNYKPFKEAGIDPDHRFQYDLRKGTDYVPAWIFEEIPLVFDTYIISHEHLIKDLDEEFNKLVQDRQLRVEFRMINVCKSAKDAIREINRLCAQYGGEYLNEEYLFEEIEVGYTKVYRIDITNTFMTKYRTIGYMITYVNPIDKKLYVKFALNYDILVRYFISIEDTHNNFRYTIKQAFKNYNTVVSSLMYPIDIINKQTELMKKERLAVLEYKAAVARVKEEDERTEVGKKNGDKKKVKKA